MSLHTFKRANLPDSLWKNGGGSTCEIACWPQGAGLADFGWRVSIARIAQSGPFSVFAGVDRHIMLLEGSGVQLHSPQGNFDHALDVPHVPFAFSGDVAVDCTLRGEASSDFNVMTRRGLWRAEVQVLAHATQMAPTTHGVLMVLAGHWQISDGGAGEPSSLEAGDGLCWADSSQAWQLTPQGTEARLVLVRFTKAGF
jgi:environmental stress-induced protein Ves